MFFVWNKNLEQQTVNGHVARVWTTPFVEVAVTSPSLALPFDARGFVSSPDVDLPLEFGGVAAPAQLFFNWIAAGGGAPVWWPEGEHPLRSLVHPPHVVRRRRHDEDEDEDEAEKVARAAPRTPAEHLTVRTRVTAEVVPHRWLATPRARQLELAFEAFNQQWERRLAAVREADDELLLLGML